MDDILKKIKVKEILFFIVVLFIFLAFETILFLLGIDFKNLTLNKYLIIMFAKYCTIILILIIKYHQYLKEKWFDFFKNFKEFITISAKDWLTGFLIMIISNLILIQIIGNNGENEKNVQFLIMTTPIIAFIMTTIIAPFIEEMIFRKALGDCFHKGKFNAYVFMIMSGFVFGLVHVMGAENPLEYLLIIPYGALGFMFSHTLIKTNNIYGTIIMHAFHNGILTLLSIMVNL